MRPEAGPKISLPEFAPDDAEAAARYAKWRMVDPHPDIEPALLNSADLLDYVAVAGMLYPVSIKADNTKEWLKPASCALACAGDWVRYDLDRTTLELKPDPASGRLGPESRLKLLANSITFLYLETAFRIPVYLAARFNLAIREIHRGILVGTGPLVDPGFDGRLFIPLHNLTVNDYSIKYGEPLVWVEFTKLSRNRGLERGSPQPRVASFFDFPEYKRERKSIEAYLDHANEGNPIASSIPRDVAVATAKVDENTRIVARTRTFSIAGALAIVALMATLFAGTVGAFVYTLTYTDGRVGDQKSLTNSVGRLQTDLKAICVELKLRSPRAKPPAGCKT